jgi:tRNA (cytidine/uridine-2'-O-)-methyltransferase
MRLALYQPDIPQNCGAAIRLCACLGVPLELIQPFGFIWDEAQVKRVAMDYLDHVTITKHLSFETFRAAYPENRLILLSTKASLPYTQFAFKPDDILLLGQESAGVPEAVHQASTARVLVPMQQGLRSLNVVMSGAIVLGEALRQTTMS